MGPVVGVGGGVMGVRQVNNVWNSVTKQSKDHLQRDVTPSV